jgi:hypothetical protein
VWVVAVDQVVRAGLQSCVLACSDEIESTLKLRSACASWDWSGLMTLSAHNYRVQASKQELLRECRAVEAVFALLGSLRGILRSALASPAMSALEFFAIKVSVYHDVLHLHAFVVLKGGGHRGRSLHWPFAF